MFKRGELDESGEGTVQPTGPARTTVNQPGSPVKGSGSATIGPSIKIKGDVTGDEDLGSVVDHRLRGLDSGSLASVSAGLVVDCHHAVAGFARVTLHSDIDIQRNSGNERRVLPTSR